MAADIFEFAQIVLYFGSADDLVEEYSGFAVRIESRKLGTDLYAGLEYYADFGEIGNFKPLSEHVYRIKLAE